MKGQSLGYVRVSTIDQSTGRQTDALAFEGINIDKLFIEKVSAKDRNRPELALCIDYAREGDTIYVHSIDRLARSLHDLEDIVKSLVAKGVTVHFIKGSMIYTKDNANPFSMMTLRILGIFAEFERDIMLERQREGIAHAKAHGTKTGNPFGQKPLDMRLSVEAIRLHNEGMSNRQIALAMKISRPSVAKLLTNTTDVPKTH